MASIRWYRVRTHIFLFVARFLRGMTLGVRVMLIEGERVLLIRHTYVPGWQLPGGGIEPGETAEDAAAREVREETGYRLTDRPTLFGFYHNCRTSRRDHVALYVTRTAEREIVFTGNVEIAEIGWFPIDSVPAETTNGTRRRIAEVFGGAERDPVW